MLEAVCVLEIQVLLLLIAILAFLFLTSSQHLLACMARAALLLVATKAGDVLMNSAVQ